MSLRRWVVFVGTTLVLVALLIFGVVETSGHPRSKSSRTSCSWVTQSDVRNALGVAVAAGVVDATTQLCTFRFTSRTGVNTDLVIGPWNQGSIDEFRLRHHRRFVVSGLGDRAVFLRANTLDDGNSVLIVGSNRQSFLIGSEFLTLTAARQLGEIVLRRLQ